MATVSASLVTGIGAASRDIVRELGVMSRTLAETGLPSSAVRALVEIGSGQQLSAKALSESLLLEKSTVSRLVKSLIVQGLVGEARSEADRRVKHLHLTQKGAKVYGAIMRYTEMRVSSAVASLPLPAQQAILDSLERYALALTASRVSGRVAGRMAEPRPTAEIVVG